jgi:hypothetical protein
VAVVVAAQEVATRPRMVLVVLAVAATARRQMGRRCPQHLGTEIRILVVEVAAGRPTPVPDLEDLELLCLQLHHL